jgi:hypothetical protein
VAVRAVGGEDERATALTVVLPLKWWGRAYLSAWFWFLQRPMVKRRRFAFDKVDDLQFISAIRWSLLPPFVPKRSPVARTREQRWQLLFESNFDGDWNEYLDSFGTILGHGLQSIVRPGIGYPGLDNVDLFKSYARANDHLPEVYESAYPELTAADIRQALAASDDDALCKIIHRGYGRENPKWSTLLFPLEVGQASAAARAARALDDAPQVLLCTNRVHFARVVVIDQLSCSWLLITMTHDGDLRSIVEEIVAAHGDRLRPLLERTQGFPVPSDGWWDDARVVDFVLDHRPRETAPALVYCGYPGWSVAHIRALAGDRRRFDRWPVRAVP